jgi:hypothetical protein
MEMECPVTSKVVLDTTGAVSSQNCEACDYPKQTNCRKAVVSTEEGSAGGGAYSYKVCEPCSTWCLGASENMFSIVFAVMSILFISSFGFLKKKEGAFELKMALGLLLYCLIPVMDTFTDLVRG